LDLDNTIPMRWPCGPLDVERGKKREGWSAREAEALTRWCDPGALELVAGTPVNCLVVTWAEGGGEDEAHQRALAPLVAAARHRGLSVVGWSGTGADLKRAAGAAQAAGLDAIATESGEPVPGGTVLRFRERGLSDRSPAEFLGIASTVWPGASPSLPTGADADAASGPTGPPWLDSNAWHVRLARTLVDPKVLWLAFDPPDLGQPVAAASYLQAVADTEVCGARWVVSLDPHLRLGLLEGRASARESWAAIGRSLAFFGKHRAWAGYVPVSQLGVVSAFGGADEFLSFEVLNLLARQSCLYRILEKSRAVAAPLAGLDAVLFVDTAPPAAELSRKLYAFAEEGGTLITPPGWEPRGVLEGDSWLARFRVYGHGRGRIAVARAELSDPYLLAEDAQLLMSHRRDRVRLFNAGTAQFHHAASADGRSGVLHALVFPMTYPRSEMTAWFREPWASGRVFMVENAEPAPAERSAVEAGVEFHLPPVPVYCALEVSA
jgi:hypothetical protein